MRTLPDDAQSTSSIIQVCSQVLGTGRLGMRLVRHMMLTALHTPSCGAYIPLLALVIESRPGS